VQRGVHFAKEIKDFLEWSVHKLVGKEISPLGKEFTEYEFAQQYYDKMDLSKAADVDPDKHKLDSNGNLISCKTGEMVAEAISSQKGSFVDQLKPAVKKERQR